MHYKGHVITKEIPTSKRLEEILSKYKEDFDREDKVDFEWDWWQIGGRYGGEINIKFDPNENEDKWYMNHTRNYKYFIIDILDDIKQNIKFYDELDYLLYMGLNDKILHVDGGHFNDMIDFDISNCFMVIDDEDNLYVRQSWNGEDWIEDKGFDDKVKAINLENKFITIIDFHD